MKSKLFAKVIAALSAMTMAVTMMVTSASAAETTWSVYYTRSASQPGAPYQSQKTDNYKVKTISTLTYFKTQCTSYSSEKDTNGDLKYATVNAKRYDPRGIDPTVTVSSNYNHRSKDSGYKTRDLSPSVGYGYELRVYYTLNGPSIILGSVSGKFYVPSGTIYVLS